MINHAYSHLIGRTVGMKVDGKIIGAMVRTPELSQDHNLLLITLDDGSWDYVRAMDTYRTSMINN